MGFISPNIVHCITTHLIQVSQRRKTVIPKENISFSIQMSKSGDTSKIHCFIYELMNIISLYNFCIPYFQLLPSSTELKESHAKGKSFHSQRLKLINCPLGFLSVLHWSHFILTPFLYTHFMLFYQQFINQNRYWVFSNWTQFILSSIYIPYFLPFCSDVYDSLWIIIIY